MLRVVRDQLVYVSRKPTGEIAWGYEQFPKLCRAKEGSILLHISANLDLWKVERLMSGPIVFASQDEGESFVRLEQPPSMLSYVRLGGGLAAFPKRAGISTANLPALNEHRPKYGYNGRTAFSLHAFDALPPEEQGLVCRVVENGVESIRPGRLHGVETAYAMESEWTGGAENSLCKA